MDRFSRRRSLSRLVLAQNEGACHHANRHPAEQTVNILICHRSCLLIELLIDGSPCHLTGTRLFAATAKVSSKRVDAADECRTAGLHELLQTRLMEEGTVRNDRAGDSDEDAPANIANEVDNSRNLIASLFR